MYIRFDEHRVTVHTTRNSFLRKSAIEKVDSDEWVRIMRETAEVERRMNYLRQANRTIFVR